MKLTIPEHIDQDVKIIGLSYELLFEKFVNDVDGDEDYSEQLVRPRRVPVVLPPVPRIREIEISRIFTPGTLNKAFAEWLRIFINENYKTINKSVTRRKKT